MTSLNELGRTETPRASPASDLEVQPMETNATALRQHLGATPGHRILVAVLCIAAVLVWLFTMHTMSSAGAELVSHGHPAIASGSIDTADEHVPVGAISTVASGEASGAPSAGDIACSLFGIGCIVALLVAAIRTLPARAAITRFMSGRLARIVEPLMQRLPRPPSLIELSISRT